VKNVYNKIIENKSKGQKQIAVLVDPDNLNNGSLEVVASTANGAEIDFIFIGGSLLSTDKLSHCISLIKEVSNIPTVIFPGSPLQIDGSADAILFLSLISGRNPEFLIGNHVIAAPYLRNTNLEILPTGYLLIDSGAPTTASYMSNSTPIPHNKSDIAVCTALAGEMLGLKLIYLDGGSGASNVISDKMISEVKQQISLPLIVGGGINSVEKAVNCSMAGADLIVIGNATEKDPYFINEVSEAIKVVTNSEISSNIQSQ